MTYEQALALMQRVVLGELDEVDAEFAAAVNSFPQLQQELAELRRVQRALDDDVHFTTADAADIAAEAALLSKPADRQRVARALGGKRRRSHLWPLLFAALVAVLVTGFWWRPFRGSDGMLGPTGSVTLVQRGDSWVVEGLPELASGDSYAVRLLIDGKPRGEEFFGSPSITLPNSWTQLTNGAVRPRLEISSRGGGDLPVRIDWQH